MICKGPGKKKPEFFSHHCACQIYSPLPQLTSLVSVTHLWAFTLCLVSAFFSLLAHQYTGLQSFSETLEMID